MLYISLQVSKKKVRYLQLQNADANDALLDFSSRDDLLAWLAIN